MLEFERSGVDVGITVPGAKAASGAPVDGGIVFANAARDLDVLVRPGGESVELSALLRSPAAARTMRLRVDSRPGDRLVTSLPHSTGPRQGPPGGAVLLRHGRPVVAVSPATASDAQGQVLEVDAEIDGDELVYTVEIPEDTAWPVALDPYVSEDQRYWSTNGAINFTGWSSGFAGGTFGTFAGSSGFGRGLYLFSGPNQPYASGAYAAWRYVAPNVPGFTPEAARVFKADFSFATHTVSNRGSCIGEGIFNTGENRFEPAGRFRGSQTTDTYTLYAAPYTVGYLNCGPVTNGYAVHCLAVCGLDGGPDTGGSPANGVTLNLYQGAGTPTTGAVVFLQGSLIFMSEHSGPHTAFTSTAPAGWTKDPFTINATVTDYGLGINNASVSAPGASGPLATATQVAACATGTPPSGGGTPGSSNQGDRDHRCTAPLTLSQPSGALPDGSYNVSVLGNDILGNAMQAPNSTPVKIDRIKPTLSVDRPHAPSQFVKPADVLQLRATDAHSGVASMSFSIDGGPASTPVTCSTDGCPLSVPYTVDEAMAEGPHTVTISAVDRAGNPDTGQFSFSVDATPPETLPHGIVAAEGADEGSLPLTGSSYELLADAYDTVDIEAEDDEDNPPPPTVVGSGVAVLELRIDGQVKPTTVPAQCPSGIGCEKSLAYTWNTSAVSDGPHTFELRAVDVAGNEDVSTWKVTIAHPPAQAPRTNTLTRTIRGAGGMRAGTGVAALGDVNSDGRADYLVGTPGATVAGRPAGAAYLVPGSATETDTDLAAASPTLFKISGPSESAGASYCGSAVAAAGDVNGDDIGDYLIACPGLDTSDPLLAGLTQTRGRVYVVFGSSTPRSVDLSATTLGDNGFVITGPAETAGLGLLGVIVRPTVFGERVTSAPDYGGDGVTSTQDVNGDGLNDIVIGDAKANSAYVVFGRAGTSPVDATNLGSSGYAIVGSTGLVGHSAAIVDDITHDGLADAIVGAPGAASALSPGLGAAYIVPGSTTRTGSVSLGATGQGIVKLTTGVPGDRFGAGVAALGDTDLDGRADFAVSTKSGAFVVRTAPTTDQTITTAQGFAVTSPAANTGGLLGTGIPETALAPAGDLDGDYRHDLVVGYPDAGDRRAYTILSPAGNDSIAVSSALPGQSGSSTATGTAGDRSGAAVGASSYVGSNPVTENARAIIGAPSTNPNLPIVAAGAAYIVGERVPTGPETTLDVPDPDPGPFARRSLANGLYRLEQSDPWSTIRNKYSQFIMGHAAGGSYFDAFGYEHQWLRGKSYHPTVRRCGWVDNKHIPMGANGAPIAANRDPDACKGPKYVPPKYFAKLVNCDICNDGGGVSVLDRPGGGHWPIYRNVHPGTREHRHELVALLRKNAFVHWRYITKSGRFVLIKVTKPSGSDEPQLVDGEGELGEARWGFVSRAAFPAAFGQGGLCGGRSGGTTATGVTRDGKQRAGRTETRNGKTIPLWPPVCERFGPGS